MRAIEDDSKLLRRSRNNQPVYNQFQVESSSHRQQQQQQQVTSANHTVFELKNFPDRISPWQIVSLSK